MSDPAKAVTNLGICSGVKSIAPVKPTLIDLNAEMPTRAKPQGTLRD
jgi:hypothetical protein